MNFSTEVKVSLYDFEVESKAGEKRIIGLLMGKAKISWSLDIEAREWGIKGMYAYVPDQTVKARIELDEDEEDVRTLEVNLEIKDADASFQSADWGTLSPQEITFYKNKWEIT